MRYLRPKKGILKGIEGETSSGLLFRHQGEHFALFFKSAFFFWMTLNSKQPNHFNFQFSMMPHFFLIFQISSVHFT